MLASHAKKEWTKMWPKEYTFDLTPDQKELLCQNCDYIRYGKPDRVTDINSCEDKMARMVETFFEKEDSWWEILMGDDSVKAREFPKLRTLLSAMDKIMKKDFSKKFIESLPTTYKQYKLLKNKLGAKGPSGGYLRNKRKSRNRKSKRRTITQNKGKRKKTGRSKRSKRSKGRSKRKRRKRSKRRNSRRMKRRSRK